MERVREFLEVMYSINMTSWQRTDLLKARDKEVKEARSAGYRSGFWTAIIICIITRFVAGWFFKH